MKTKTITVYGEITAAIDASAPEGFFARIHFPTLAKLDTWTGDGRRIRSEGFGVRPLPLSIARQVMTGAGGHVNSVNVGRLDTVTVDGDNASGDGWLLDNPDGREAYVGIQTQAYRGNSVDLADVDVAVNLNFEEDYEVLDDDGKETGFFHMGQVKVDFMRANIAATTLVMTPAFAQASAEVELVAEMQASLDAGETPYVEAAGGWTIGDYVTEEVLASATLEVEQIIQPATAFRRPEAAERTNITVDEDGNVYGHLGQWNDCHTGVVDRCVIIPKSRNGYASFLKCNVLTDEGLVPTGPLMLFNGHPKTGVLRPDNVTEVYGGIENAWADITIRDGVIGPWMCGRVRPTATPEQIYAARASNVSGHWLNGNLYAAVSVNAPGYDVPRAFTTGGDGAVLELVATSVPCECNSDGERLTDAEVAWLDLEFAALAANEEETNDSTDGDAG